MDEIIECISKLEEGEEKLGTQMVLVAFQELEKELRSIAEEAPKAHNPVIYELKARLANLISNSNAAVSRFQNILPSLARKGWDIINMIWTWFTGRLIEFLSQIGKKLGISGWSVGTTASFPTGVSASITVHFTVET